MARYLGLRRIYDSMRQEYYWSHIQNYVYSTVKYFCSCASEMVTVFMKQRHLKLFPSRDPL